MACVESDNPKAISNEVLESNDASDDPSKKTREENSSDPNLQHGSVVAAHYNLIEEKGLRERLKSPILYLRNFNNWVKSVVIQEFISKIQEKNYGKRIRVLDICCGKGGDIVKWTKARVEHVVFADIADVSVQQCKARYEDARKRGCRFSAEFLTLDCTKQTLRDKYKDPSISFDLASCQFALHYSFESLAQARQMLSNVSDCIGPNGYFIGTIPDANEIISRARKAPDASFGNKIYNIKLHFDPNNGGPLFGAKYDVHLEGVVDCPEFLVNFNLLTMLAAEYGLQLVYKASFADFFKEHSDRYKFLLQKIMCFESYPPPHGKELNSAETEYEHAKTYLENREKKSDRDFIGTMSQSEWEVATLYMVFAFKKLKHSWDKNGKPVYEVPEPQRS